jgi:hypothetical protein
VSVTSIHARRLTAQLLAGAPARDPLAVAERLLAIQAQDPRGARLAIRARTAGVSAADIDRELTERRSLVITTLNRGTLHLVRSEDYPLLHLLTTPPLFTTSATRLARDGIDPDTTARAMSLIEQAIEDDGPQTRGHARPAGARRHPEPESEHGASDLPRLDRGPDRARADGRPPARLRARP